MAKFTLVLVVVLLAFLDFGLSGYAGSRFWNQGKKAGSQGGQCSAIKGLPDPKSGCCGRHAGADGGGGGGDDNDIDDGDQEGGNDNGNGNDDDGDDTGDDYPTGGGGGGGGDGGGGFPDGIGGGFPDGIGGGFPNGIGGGFPNGIGGGFPNGIGGGFPNGIGGGFPNGIGGGFPNGIGGGFPNGIGGGFPNGIGGGFPNGIGGGFPNGIFSQKYRNKRSNEKNASDITPDKYITAGRPTGIAQYPWLVHLQVKVEEILGTKIVGCGGSLISSRHVITAAHCLDHPIKNTEDVSIFLAEYNTRSFPKDCVGTQCIKNMVMHPDKLKIHEKYERGVLYNDIGMMRLRRNAPYTDYIRPICIPPFNINNQKGGTTLTITGWGRVGDNAEASAVKLHTQVQLVSPATCQQHYPDLTKGQVCAAGKRGRDTCMGDSGGPIMLEKDGSYYLVGLVSGKKAEAGCGSPVPTLYTNVFAYKDWIDNFMRN